MIVAFPCSFPQGMSVHQHAIARLFVDSVRQHRWISLVQVSDALTPMLEGVEAVHREPREADFGSWYFNAFMSLPYPQFLRLDYDTMLLSDVSRVFERSFDIAIAEEENGVMNNGVVFFKNKSILEDARDNYIERTGRDGWQDIQRAMQMSIDSGRFDVLRLDRSYNMPYSRDMPLPKILHFKGEKRKNKMRELYAIR